MSQNQELRNCKYCNQRFHVQSLVAHELHHAKELRSQALYDNFGSGSNRSNNSNQNRNNDSAQFKKNNLSDDLNEFNFDLGFTMNQRNHSSHGLDQIQENFPSSNNQQQNFGNRQNSTHNSFSALAQELHFTTCPLCQDQIVQEFADEHLSQCNGIPERIQPQRIETSSFKCPQCALSFNHEGEFNDHLEAHQIADLESGYNNNSDDMQINDIPNASRRNPFENPQSRRSQRHEEERKRSSDPSMILGGNPNDIIGARQGSQNNSRHREQARSQRSSHHSLSQILNSLSGGHRGARGIQIIQQQPNGRLIIQNDPNMQLYALMSVLNQSQGRAALGDNVPNFENMNEQQIYEYFTNLDQKINQKPLSSDMIDSLPETKFKKNEHAHQANNNGVQDEEETKCSICQCKYLEGEDLKTLTCFHKYHKECISEWLHRQNFCPICRTEIKVQ
eukprot:403372055